MISLSVLYAEALEWCEMPETNEQLVFRSFELLSSGLSPFVEQKLKAKFGDQWASALIQRHSNLPSGKCIPFNPRDNSTLLNGIVRNWNEVFRDVLEQVQRNYVYELIGFRNRLSHNHQFNNRDAARALDTAIRLLRGISADGVADEIERLHEQVIGRLPDVTEAKVATMTDVENVIISRTIGGPQYSGEGHRGRYDSSNTITAHEIAAVLNRSGLTSPTADEINEHLLSQVDFGMFATATADGSYGWVYRKNIDLNTLAVYLGYAATHLNKIGELRAIVRQAVETYHEGMQGEFPSMGDCFTLADFAAALDESIRDIGV